MESRCVCYLDEVGNKQPVCNISQREQGTLYEAYPAQFGKWIGFKWMFETLYNFNELLVWELQHKTRIVHARALKGISVKLHKV